MAERNRSAVTSENRVAFTKHLVCILIWQRVKKLMLSANVSVNVIYWTWVGPTIYENGKITIYTEEGKLKSTENNVDHSSCRTHHDEVLFWSPSWLKVPPWKVMCIFHFLDAHLWVILLQAYLSIVSKVHFPFPGCTCINAQLCCCKNLLKA